MRQLLAHDHALIALVALAGCEKASERTDDKRPEPPLPRPVEPAPEPPLFTCGAVPITLTMQGVWIGLAPGACYAPRTGSGNDMAWLVTEVTRVREALVAPCGTVSRVMLQADDAVPYGDVLEVMASMRKVGISDIRLAANLSPVFPTGKQRTSCDRVVVANDASDIPTLTITISPTHILVAGKVVMPIGGTADGSGPIAELASALGKGGGEVVLQTDPAVDARVIIRVVDTAKQAGFSKIQVGDEP